ARLGLTLGFLTCLNVLGSLILLPLFLRMFNPAFIYKDRILKDDGVSVKEGEVTGTVAEQRETL
ncbi:MAG: hypothetical protein KAJ08_01505, partial [Deltaproteobacteria bacterium]|nr:hypothetical protein [Deltaproteobacteria bacterium]